MSKQSTIEECGVELRSRSSQKTKTASNALAADVANNMAETQQSDLAAVLRELQSLRTTVTSINTKMNAVDGFGSKLDSVEKRLTEMNGSVTAVERRFADLQEDIVANAKRLTEAESRIGSAEDDLNFTKTQLADAVKRIAHLESKTEGLENYGRRKNLRLVGLPEGAEKSQPMVEYIQHMLPLWLKLDASKSFVLERAHRTLARPKPGQNRAVIIRFLMFQDREFVFRSSKQLVITHEGHKLFFRTRLLPRNLEDSEPIQHGEEKVCRSWFLPRISAIPMQDEDSSQWENNPFFNSS